MKYIKDMSSFLIKDVS